MGYLLASGNQLIWVRPTLQNAIQHNSAVGGKIRSGQAKNALEALKWGDEDGPIDTKSWFSIAYDPQNSYWIARHNVAVCRSFMRGVTGGAVRPGAFKEDLWLSSPGFSTGQGPALALMDYQYVTQGAPKLRGNANRVPQYAADDLDRVAGWAMRTRYVRQLDASIMTPDERLCEMTQCAVTDKNFSSEMRAQFGVVGDPNFLLSMALIMGVFVGIGAGAQLLGGAAFAAALSRFMGIGMIGMQVKGYVKLFEQLRDCCFSEKQADFVKGIQTVQQILYSAVRDIAVLVTMEGAMKIGSKAMSLLKSLFSKYAPKDWVEAAGKAKGDAEVATARLRARIYGYAGENFLKGVAAPLKLFREAELRYFLKRSARDREMIVIRGPSTDRMAWLDKLSRWVEGKPPWIQAKSGDGWHGLLCIPKNDGVLAQIRTAPEPPFQMGNLKGVFDEVDTYIAGNPVRPTYKLPPGLKVKDGNGDCFKWEIAGRNQIDAQGYRLVDIGDKYLIVDRLGQPVAQDLDIGALQQAGKPAGAHLGSGKNAAHPEDNFYEENMMNWTIAQDESGGLYNPVKHGGGGGSARHYIEQTKMGNKAWSPRSKDGSFKAEELYVFLPFKRANWTSNLFKFSTWGDLEAFCKANKIDFPF